MQNKPVVIIIKYGNRKLYVKGGKDATPNQYAGKYIGLTEIRNLLKEGFDIKVLSGVNRDDITKAQMVSAYAHALRFEAYNLSLDEVKERFTQSCSDLPRFMPRFNDEVVSNATVNGL